MNTAQLGSMVCAAVLLGFGCASTEVDPKTPTASGPRPADGGAVQPKPQPKPNATVAIASVQMIEDCPHQDQADAPAKPAAEAPAMPDPSLGDMDPGAHDSRVGPGIDQCTQSTMQLAFKSAGEGSADIKITAVRIRRADNDNVLGTIEARKPKRWSKDNRYEPWDQVVNAGEDTKASYKLSVPDWNAVQKAVGSPGFGFMFELEVDVEVDGTISTVVSPEFTREEPHVVVT